jgi:hypothetical protein
MMSNMHCGPPLLNAYYAPEQDQLQGLLVIQSYRPTNGKLQPLSELERVVRRKQHAGAGDIHGFTTPGYLAPALLEYAITHVTLDRESFRPATIAWGFHSSYVLVGCETFRLPHGPSGRPHAGSRYKRLTR